MSEPKISCPVCQPAVELKPLRLHGRVTAPLHWCRQCRGIWGQARALGEALRPGGSGHAVLGSGVHSQLCRHCGKRVSETNHCESCGLDVRLDCPECRTRMDRVKMGRVSVDLCRPCKAAWFDRDELGTVRLEFREHARQALQSKPQTAAAVAQGGGPGSEPPHWVDALDLLSVTDPLFFEGLGYSARVVADTTAAAPEVAAASFEGAVHVAGAAADGAVTLVSGTIEVAGSAAEAAGELVGGVLEFLGSVFEGLSP